MSTTETKSPSKTIKSGTIEGTIWENQSEKNGPFPSVTFTRSFKSNGTIKSTSLNESLGLSQAFFLIQFPLL